MRSRRPRLILIVAALAVLCGWGSDASAQESPRKPNIVLIVADDLGYGELGAQGNKDIPTPQIDSIAAHGVRFTQGYVSCPVCSPTRAGLMTGRYQQRFGHEHNPGPAEQAAAQFGLPLSETTLAQRLHDLGYVTGMVGKWHLGYRAGYQPQDRGFDEFFGFLGGAHSYLREGKNHAMLRGTTPIEEPEYLTDAFAREAVAFVERNKSRPFFLYLPFNAVHSPLQTTAKYDARFSGMENGKRKTFAGMLTAMDDAVGRVLGKLKELNLTDNTIIVFISDNGGPTPQTTAGNGPLRGFKGTIFEGGVRVPFFVQWPARLPAGRVYEQPVISLDILPSLVVAGGGMPAADWKLDGVNLWPYLQGENQARPHETLYWRFGEQWAIRHGDWKLARPANAAQPLLFNLADDIGEQRDLAAAHPDRVRQLTEAYNGWNSQLADPLWRKGAGKKKVAK